MNAYVKKTVFLAVSLTKWVKWVYLKYIILLETAEMYVRVVPGKRSIKP
jgi:hypothetical protein